ncbi:MAG TPA: hypothetical protein VHZ76_05950 [Gammaproteobacteria bacterium]|jgi:hypothetical protein|nr:hypothetical protein [Gammaproteobacteria bacterium]
MISKVKKTGAFNMFRKLQERERTGKLKPICYVGLTHLYTGMQESQVKDFFLGNLDQNTSLYDRIAYSTEEAAHQDVQKRIEDFAKRNGCCIANEKYPTTFDKADLKENAYWIFIVKGSYEEITNFLSLNKPGPNHSFAGQGFGEKILTAKNNLGTQSLTRAQVLNEILNEKKPESRPSSR